MINISIHKRKGFTPENFKNLPVLARLGVIVCLKFFYGEKAKEICKFLVISRKSIYNWNKLVPKECKDDFYKTKSFFKSQKINIFTKKSSKTKNLLQIEINELENKAYEIICFGSSNVIENKDFKDYLFNGYTTNSLAKETSKSVSTIGRYRKELLDNTLAEKQNTLVTNYIQKNCININYLLKMLKTCSMNGIKRY